MLELSISCGPGLSLKQKKSNLGSRWCHQLYPYL